VSPQEKIANGLGANVTPIASSEMAGSDSTLEQAAAPTLTLPWAVTGENMGVLLSDNATDKDRRLVLLETMQDPSLDLCDYVHKYSGGNLVAGNFSRDYQHEAGRAAWLNTLTSYAKRACEVEEELGHVEYVFPLKPAVRDAFAEATLEERAEGINELQDMILKHKREPQMYEDLKRRLSAKDFEDLENDAFIQQVYFLDYYRQDFYEKLEAPQQAVDDSANPQLAKPTIEAAAAPLQDFSITRLPEIEMPEPAESAAEPVNTSTQAIAAEIQTMCPSSQSETVTSHQPAAGKVANAIDLIAQRIKDVDFRDAQSKPVNVAVAWIAALGIHLAVKATTGDEAVRESTSTMIELAADSTVDQWGKLPEGLPAVSVGIPEGAEQTAAASILAHAIERQKTGLIMEATAALNVSPLAYASRKDWAADQPIARTSQNRMVNYSIEYMKRLTSIADSLGNVNTKAEGKDPNSRRAIERIRAFSIYGLERLKDNEAALTPEQLNAAAEQFANALIAATYPDAASEVWHDEVFESELEDELAGTLNDSLFAEDGKAYTDEQKHLITNFLARAVALTTPEEEKALRSSVGETTEAADNIMKTGNAEGEKQAELNLFHGRYLPEGNSHEDRLYRFFMKRFITKHGFSPDAAHTAAAGAVGNFTIESAYFSVIDAWGGGGGDYYGIAQLSRNHRFVNLKKFASKRNLDYRDFDTQLAFIDYELSNYYKTAFEMLKSEKYSSADKAAIFGRHYEIALTNGALQLEDRRREEANKYQSQLHDEEERAKEKIRASAPDAGTPETHDWRQHVSYLGKHETYVNGERKIQRLYAIDGFMSTGNESTPDSPYYVDGAKSRVIVAEAIVAQTVALFQAAKKDGITLQAASSWRSNDHQIDLAAANPNRNEVAAPQFSNHEGGVAFDIILDGYPIQASAYGTKNGGMPSESNPRVAPDSKVWKWLKENAPKFGFRQFWNEPWHWSPAGS
jgi:hypothetical protein